MYQCGCYNRTRAFPASLVPADTGFGKAKVFEGPLQSISADDTSVGEFMVGLLLLHATPCCCVCYTVNVVHCLASCWCLIVSSADHLV